MKLLSIAGARPNFMKLASIARAVKKHNAECKEVPNIGKIEHIIVHTGQHYDSQMSNHFFEELDIPLPDVNLEVGSGSHAQQTAEIMKRFEPVLLQRMPDVLVVVGDVNSTIACTLVASKIQYPTNNHKLTRPIMVHVEAGLRSFDRKMPEEINRILTDSLCDLLFVTEDEAITNLMREGISPKKIHFVGNVMIDTLCRHLELAKKSQIKKELGIVNFYGLVTLHRPSNVDKPETLKPLVKCLNSISSKLPLIFPLHPRTRNNLNKFGLLKELELDKIKLTYPLGYLDFLNLVKDARLVLTDSGGIQEETTFLGIPCITLRENTERPVTVKEGSNYLTGTKPEEIVSTIDLILSGKGKKSNIPKYWDGKAGGRIVSIIVNAMNLPGVSQRNNGNQFQ